MRKRIQYNSNYEKSRWVGFFDLLGIKSLIKNKDTVSVFVAYSHAIEQIKDRIAAFEDMECAWFSDSFLVYTADDSIQSFRDIDLRLTWFSYFLITGKIPLRGAISCGSLYVDRENVMFFGEALIEAYQYAEAQDWIGFLLCPSVQKQLTALGYMTEVDVNYAYTNIPYNKRGSELVQKLPACILGAGRIIFGPDNPCIVSLRTMKDKETDDTIIQKYENTIKFLESNQRTIGSSWP